MTKQDILNKTGLSEEEFYQRFPDQETFCFEYPDMCPDIMDDEEDMSDNYNIESSDDDSLYEAEDGVETTAPYTDYNQYKNAMQTYGAQSAKANTYNNFQNDLYSYANQKPGSSETANTLGNLFNTLSPEQQDALAQKYNAEFITNTPSANRRNYINSMEMNIPGKGTGYYSFPTNDVVYGTQKLERPTYEFPRMVAPQYAMQPAPKKFDIEPTQLINNISAGYKNPSSLNTNNNNLPIPKYSLNKTMEKVGATNQPFVTTTPNYSSIIDLLKARKLDSSFASRKKLAEEIGIKNYTGSASQNMDFINRINSNNITPNEDIMQKGGTYTIKPGDNLSLIAKRNNISLKELLNNNPNIKNPNLIHQGDKVNISNPVNYVSAISKPAVSNSQINKNFYGDFKQNVTPSVLNRTVDKSKGLPNKKQQPVIPMPIEQRHLESGMIEDKNKNVMYVVKDNKVVKTFPIITGLTRNGNLHSKDLAWMEAHPKEAALKYRTTPTGNYFAKPNSDIYGKAGFNLNPISAFGEPAPEAKSTAIHVIYPKDYKRRMKIMAGPGEKRNASYGCTNMYGQDIDCLTGQLFPKGDTTIIVDTRIPKDNRFIQSFQRELGGTAIHPAMRTNFKQGGYYGMDGKLHRAKGSGTYVMNGGYYFDEGGASTAPPVASPDTPPGAVGAPIAVPPSSLIDDNMPNADGTFDVNNDYENYTDDVEQSDADYNNGTDNTKAKRKKYQNDIQYETPDLGGLDPAYEQEQQKPVVEPYDASKYASGINPATGFTTWSKGNQQLTNIKKQDPALWEHLKDEGHGARWRTGQTDVQKFGRTAGKIGNTLQAGIDIAGAFGQFFNNRTERKNLSNAAINQGSTASIYKNPQSASKGDYGQTGSSYGSQNPYSVGARSFKGMYGKYGMEVPKFQPGGGFSNLFSSAQSVVPIKSPISLMSNISFEQLPVFSKPTVENTKVYQNNQNVNNNSGNIPSKGLDVEAALQAVAGVESGSKPGENKAGMRTKLVGAGGKRASASGTYQITTPTLQDIYNNDKSISSKYDTFKQFKSAFDVDANVEYEAAKSLMSRHIKDYGIYALGAWYQPEFARRAAKGDKSVFNIVPAQDYGNKVKWGDDFAKKLNAYNKIAGTNYTPNTTFNIQTSTTPTNTNFSLKDLINLAKKNNFDVTSTTGGGHNVGSRHYKGRAIDVRTKNKTPEEINQFMNIARSAGYRVLDERVRPKGQKKWDGQHLHIDFQTGGQLGGQVVEMDEKDIKQFLKAGGQLEFLD
jgi:LysM repeat protein